MSEVRLVIREEHQDWSGTVHGSVADRAIAALSDDPTTLAELEQAVARFEAPRAGWKFFCNLRRGLNDEPHDAGLVVIDLAARLVVTDSSYSAASMKGCIEYHDGERCTDTRVWFHLAEDWLLSSEGLSWEANAKRRRKERAAQREIDARPVFYGQPLLESLARGTFAAFARREEIAAASREKWKRKHVEWLARKRDVPPESIDAREITEEDYWPKTWSEESRHASLYYDALKDLHAAWLLTPRDDLGGRSPRQVALEDPKHEHLSRQLNDRSGFWSCLEKPPPALLPTSHAFRFAGFYTHELVMHYYLVRELLWSSWDRLMEMEQSKKPSERPGGMEVGDFLTAEVPRLAQVRDAWLNKPDPEYHGRTPRSIIDRERARLPEVLGGDDLIIDHDCPMCQMMADMPGPTFWDLDGCNMDDEFAFAIHYPTREAWEANQRDYEEFSRKMDAKEKERKALGVDYGDDKEGAIWKRSFAVDSTADVPLGIRLFGIGAHLAEVNHGLRGGADRDSTPAEAQQQIDRLNRDFGNLCDILRSSDVSLAASLIEPAIDRFAESLDLAARSHEDLSEQCEELTSELRRLLDPPAAEKEWSGEYPGPFGDGDSEDGDMDIPF